MIQFRPFFGSIPVVIPVVIPVPDLHSDLRAFAQE